MFQRSNKIYTLFSQFWNKRKKTSIESLNFIHFRLSQNQEDLMMEIIFIIVLHSIERHSEWWLNLRKRNQDKLANEVHNWLFHWEKKENIWRWWEFSLSEWLRRILKRACVICSLIKSLKWQDVYLFKRISLKFDQVSNLLSCVDGVETSMDSP